MNVILFLLYVKMTQVHRLVVKLNSAWMHFCKIYYNNFNLFMKGYISIMDFLYICKYPLTVWSTISPNYLPYLHFLWAQFSTQSCCFHVKCFLWSQWKLCMWERFMVCRERWELQMWFWNIIKNILIQKFKQLSYSWYIMSMHLYSKTSNMTWFFVLLAVIISNIFGI